MGNFNFLLRPKKFSTPVYFWLEPNPNSSDTSVFLCAETSKVTEQILLEISERGISLYPGPSPDLGIPLDKDGFVKIDTSDWFSKNSIFQIEKLNDGEKLI